MVAILLRLMASTGLTAAAGAGGQIVGVFSALVVGLTTPLVVEKILRQVATTAPDAFAGAAHTPHPRAAAAPGETEVSDAH